MVTLVIFSLNNGFSATMVYESIRIESRATDREFLLQTAGICAQIGSFVGTFLTVLIIARGVFDEEWWLSEAIVLSDDEFIGLWFIFRISSIQHSDDTNTKCGFVTYLWRV